MVTRRQKDLSIVIPAYNEEKRLGASLASLKHYLETVTYSWEVILVDDGSTDTTIDVARASGIPLVVLQNKMNRGKGYVVKQGIQHATGDLVLFADADFSTPIEEVERLQAEIQKGFDVVIASRSIKGSTIEVEQPGYRHGAGNFFSLVVQALLGLNIHDTQCGFKLFTARAAKHIAARQTIYGFCFDVEQLYIAHLLGYKIKELQVVWRDRKGSKVHLVRDGMQMLSDLWKIKKKGLRRQYAT